MAVDWTARDLGDLADMLCGAGPQAS
jgi:hypothetical protein